MSIFGSLLQLNNSLAQTRMPPHDPCKDAWYHDTVQHESHIDIEYDGAAWINNANDRTCSILSSLATQPSSTSLSPAANSPPTSAQSAHGVDVEGSTLHSGQASNATSFHNTPTIQEGKETGPRASLCACCALPLPPTNKSPPSSSPALHLPSSPLLQHVLRDTCCECYCPDTRMPSSINVKPHVRRRSSLSAQGRVEREKDGRAEMSVGAWL